MIRSLRARLLISILVPVLVIVPVVGLVLSYLLQTQVFLAGISNELIRQAVLVADLATARVEIWQDPTQAQAFMARVSPQLSAKLMLLDPQGRLILSSDPRDAQLIGNAYDMPDMQKLLEQETPVEVRYNRSQIEDIYVPAVDPNGKVIGVVRLTNPLASLYTRSEQLTGLTWAVVIGGILASLLLGYILARDLERPLKNTSQAVYELANQQRLAAPLQASGPQEIQQLVEAFNMLADRLKASEETRRRLLANMVHELGRPLGGLLSAIQALRSGAAEQQELRGELLEGMQNEVVSLRHLLDDLAAMDHSQIAIELHLQEIRLSEWLPLLSSTWAEEAIQKGLTWENNLPAGLPAIQADPEKLAQAIGNLASNAIRYTPAGGSVTFSAEWNDHLELSIQDSGPGIAPEEQESIFQPFYRGQAARRFSDGMGLGLTIARDNIRAHNGDILVFSEPGRGSRFCIHLPVTPP